MYVKNHCLSSNVLCLLLSLSIIQSSKSIVSYLPFTSESNTCPDDCQTKTSGNENEIVALILARGGSKGIPLKNLAKMNGLSLLGRAISIATNANTFTSIWVSTDSDQIGEEAKRFGSNVHFRPSYLAADNTASIDAVKEFLSKHQCVQNIALIQCTSIFLAEHYLENATNEFHKPNVDCVFSVVRSWKLRWQQSSTNTMLPINFNVTKRPRRQDWNGELIEAGMFYYATRKLIEIEGVFQNYKCRIVEIDERDSLEIDTVYHLKLATALLSYA